MRFCCLAQFLCKAEVPNFTCISLLFRHFFQQNILTLKVTMNNIFLMYSFESFQDLHEYFNSFIVFENLVAHSILIRVQVAVFAVLHYQEYRLRFYMIRDVPTKVLSSLTILGCRRLYIELISCCRYFYSDGFFANCLCVIHLMARGKNY